MPAVPHAPAFDPDLLADQRNVHVSYWRDLGHLGLYRQEHGRGYVALREDLAAPSQDRLRRVVLTHELAHDVLHESMYVGLVHCRRDNLTALHMEMQAERWAAEQLCPVAFIRAFVDYAGWIDTQEVVELADMTRIPVAFAVWWLDDLQRRGLLSRPR